MGSSDSETGSECFESAEESLDEKEETKYKKAKLKKNLQRSENEASKLIVSDCSALDSVSAEGDTSSSSLSYRKRPERVKRLPNKTQTKLIPKLPKNELILKTDKIVPDVFLQDITSNLSKNINKSLSTLQQTSSNVKDLILNSLPVSSVIDNEGFSYDDKSVLFDADENKTSTHEANYLNNNQFIESEGKIIEENIRSEKETPKGKTSNSESNISSAGEKKDENIKNKPDNIESNNLKDDFLLKNTSAYDNFKDETLNIDKENLEICNTYLESHIPRMPDENSCTESVIIVSNKKEKIIQDFNDTCLNHKNFEILAEKKETNYKDANKIESVDFREGINQEIDVCEKNNTCNKPEVDVEITEKEETSQPEKFLELIESDCSKDNAHLANCEDNNFSHETEEKTRIDTECNLEELKTALKNIVSEENIFIKENDNREDKKEVKISSFDGWDDFDFSEDEIENSSVLESCRNKKFEDNKINNELPESKSSAFDLKACTDETKVETNKSKNLVASEKNLKASIPSKSLGKQANLNITEKHDIIKESYKEPEKSKKPLEVNTVENDSWDWDNWDEIPENKEVEVTQREKSEGKKVKENSFDVSKWSGWDTFGQKPQVKQDNWGLGSWGVDALLNKATAVTQGISSVLEAGLGAPDPETLARMEKIERETLLEPVKEVIDTENRCPTEISKKNSLTNVNIFPVSGITSLVAGVTSKIVEHSKIQEIGSKVITGGLETLETFGKKTMEVLQEGDPGLKNKRALLLGNNKPVLSQVLKEAREKADRESKKAEEKELARKCHFETLFDDFQGMVHLEALEMLSRQCELKLDQIRSGMNTEEQEDLNGILEEVEQLCCLDECDIDIKSSVLDFKTLLQMSVEPLKNEISIQSIIQIHEDVSKWLQISSETESFTGINQKLVSTLAELTAAIVHQFHKSGELLSVKECRKTVEEVDALSRLTNTLCTEISRLGEKFIKLSYSRISKDGSDDVNSINEKVNNVMKNSVFYIKQAFNLLIPVIQLGAAV